jgi:hypothetical protein
MNLQEARAQFQADKPMLAARGVVLPGVDRYLTPAEKADFRIAMDAIPGLATDPSSAIPAILTTAIDPQVIHVVFSPLAFGKILGEQKRGDWLEETRMFPVVEMTGEVSSYGDFNNNGRAGINMNWPQFQSYLFQTFVRYGERELERAGLGKINYVSELDIAAASLLNRFQNLTYAFGVQTLQNYGIINNPYLSAYLTPATKAAGGTAWFTAGGSPNATANEVYNDVVALWQQVIAQTQGAVDMNQKATLALSPQSALATKFANSFGVYVSELLKTGFPNMKVEQAPQYGTQTATNPQGASTAGNVVQLILDDVDGQQVAYAAFNEKLRAHKIIPEPSAWQQKKTSGSWGTITRMPVGISQMIGI